MITGAIDTPDFDLAKLTEGEDYIKHNYITRIVATRNHIGKMLKSVGLKGLTGMDYTNSSPKNKTNRSDFASEICDITKRDKKPDIRNCSINTFPDYGGPLVEETSTFHNYVLLEDGKDEIWTFSDPSEIPAF